MHRKWGIPTKPKGKKPLESSLSNLMTRFSLTGVLRVESVVGDVERLASPEVVVRERGRLGLLPVLLVGEDDVAALHEPEKREAKGHYQGQGQDGRGDILQVVSVRKGQSYLKASQEGKNDVRRLRSFKAGRVNFSLKVGNDRNN